MSKSCEQCGTELTSGQEKFCSYTCRNRYVSARRKAERPVLICPNCEMPFSRQPCYLTKGQTFCSNKCSREWLKNPKNPEAKYTERICKHCGQNFRVANCRLRGGKHTGQFCSRQCLQDFRHKSGTFFGKKPYSGSKVFQTSDGYLNIYDKETGRTRKQHRLIMEDVLGRKLEDWESIHHKNGVRDDNRPANLEVVVGKHFSGVLLKDFYSADMERLAQENHIIKQLMRPCMN